MARVEIRREDGQTTFIRVTEGDNLDPRMLRSSGLTLTGRVIREVRERRVRRELHVIPEPMRSPLALPTRVRRIA